MTRIALIDGDSIAYRSAASVEKNQYLVETGIYERVDSWKEARGKAEKERGFIWTRKEIGTLDEAKTVLDSFMRRIFENTFVVFNLFLTPSAGVFRDAVAKHTRYKGNRDNMGPPVYLADLRKYLRDSYDAETVSGHEAEDEVSIRASEIGQDGYIVVGHDKDLLQIPGYHYDWVDNTLFSVSSIEARQALWMQVLMGDRTDNIPGCWGVGFQKAKNRVTKWIPDHEELVWDIVVEEYEKSKKLKDCPYAKETEEQTYRRVEETYWLVKLKEYRDEKPWFESVIPTKNNKNSARNIESGKKNKNQGTEGSGSAQIAREKGEFSEMVGEQKSATGATD